MNSKQATFQISRDKLFALIQPRVSVGSGGGGGGGGSQPNPDEPLKPGPWDPVIRIALKDIVRFGPGPQPWSLDPGAGPWLEPDPLPWRAGPAPDPWRPTLLSLGLLGVIARRFPAIWDVIGGLNPADLVALNPQPLPPRERFVRAAGEALVARAEQMAELAGALSDRGGERGIIIVGGYVDRLIDDWCGNGFRPKWPFPGPPPWWFVQDVSARDILVLGATLDEAAGQASDPAVGRAFGEAAAKLAQVGLERI